MRSRSLPAALLALASAAVLAMCAVPNLVAELDVSSSAYADLDEARAEGAIERGWLLPFAPGSTRDIVEIHDLDTNERCARMRIDAGDRSSFVLALEGDGFRPHRQALPALPVFSAWRSCPFSLGEASAAAESYRRAVPDSAEYEYVAVGADGQVYVFNASR